MVHKRSEHLLSGVGVTNLKDLEVPTVLVCVVYSYVKLRPGQLNIIDKNGYNTNQR